MGMAFALKLLRCHRGALRGGQGLQPVRIGTLVDEVDGDRVLAAIGLDQSVLVGHAKAIVPQARRQCERKVIPGPGR